MFIWGVHTVKIVGTSKKFRQPSISCMDIAKKGKVTFFFFLSSEKSTHFVNFDLSIESHTHILHREQTRAATSEREREYQRKKKEKNFTKSTMVIIKKKRRNRKKLEVALCF